jgi:indole-3-glycerol phosphate synthase
MSNKSIQQNNHNTPKPAHLSQTGTYSGNCSFPNHPDMHRSTETVVPHLGEQTILDRIVAATRLRVEKRKANRSLPQIIREAQRVKTGISFPFETALQKEGLSFICEVKKASPSKGIISPDFPYVKIAEEYENAGADAISVLTEPEFFMGSDDYLYEIQQKVTIPTLRKDFIIDVYQLCETKLLGASAVLLICSVLEPQALREYIAICDELSLSALVETHDEKEVESALYAGARIIGVNNRNLKDFTVDLNTSICLRKLVPNSVLFVAESGIRDEKDVKRLKQAGVDGVLIGETLMRSVNKRGMLKKLRECGEWH